MGGCYEENAVRVRGRSRMRHSNVECHGTASGDEERCNGWQKKKVCQTYAHRLVQCHRGYRFARTDDRDPRSHGYPEVSGSNPDVGKLDQTMHHILVHFLSALVAKIMDKAP